MAVRGRIRSRRVAAPGEPPLQRRFDRATISTMAGEFDERESPYELLQRGEALLRDRHYAQAAIVLERAAVLEPGKGSILEALGRALFNSAQAIRARETFEALLEVDPSSHYAHYALGQSLKRLGRVDEAATHLRLAVALDPSSPLYRRALARMTSAERHHGPAGPGIA